MAAISSLIVLCYINAELIIDHDDTWLDDFALDPMGQNGWKIDKISGYDLPNPNPIVFIYNIPKYHGPFPARYNMQRYLKCNTKHNTRLFVSFLTSYCNTDRKDDIIQFSIFDPSNSSILPSFPQHPLNHKDKLLNPEHVAFIQNATSKYYSNHSSSSTMKPICSEQSVYNENTTNSIISHLNPGQWYTSNTYKTFDLMIEGNHTYQVEIDMILFGETDEYVVISDIAVLCVQLEIPTKAPINDPTSYPTISPTENTENPSLWLGPSVQPTEVSIAKSTQYPSRAPTVTPTMTLILDATIKESTDPILTVSTITTTAMDSSQTLTKTISIVYVLVCVFYFS